MFRRGTSTMTQQLASLTAEISRGAPCSNFGERVAEFAGDPQVTDAAIKPLLEAWLKRPLAVSEVAEERQAVAALAT